MEKFQIILFEGLPIISDGENTMLIDTGAPSTIHASDSLHFCSKNYSCTTNYAGTTVSKISAMLGTNITTLLGTDVLAGYKILFDYKNKVVEFSEQENTFDGKVTTISSFMGIPIITMTIGNQKLNFFLDTGAKFSYLSNSITSSYEIIGVDEDFHPVLGKFETKYFEISTRFDDYDFTVKYGNLPPMLQKTLISGKADGIIGYDFFKRYKVVLDLENQILKYKKQID